MSLWSFDFIKYISLFFPLRSQSRSNNLVAINLCPALLLSPIPNLKKPGLLEEKSDFQVGGREYPLWAWNPLHSWSKEPSQAEVTEFRLKGFPLPTVGQAEHQ